MGGISLSFSMFLSLCLSKSGKKDIMLMALKKEREERSHESRNVRTAIPEGAERKKTVYHGESVVLTHRDLGLMKLSLVF